MTWNVTLWCNQCQKNVGSVNDVSSNRPDVVRLAMIEHEANKHAGKRGE